MTEPASAQQRQKKHLLISLTIIGIAAAFIALLAIGLTLDQTRVPAALLDKSAQPFRVAWIQGHELVPEAADANFTLADFKGKPVILNFWASWCVSCRAEAHEMEMFWERHKDEVAVVGIAIQDDKAAAERFAQYYGKTYILGLDENGKAAIDYGVSGVPETFLIDKQGMIRHKETGPVTSAMLEQLLPKIL